jgi:hypothetical protein
MRELSTAAFVGSALRSDTPGTTPDGKALTCEIRELINPDGRTEPAARSEGKALT